MSHKIDLHDPHFQQAMKKNPWQVPPSYFEGLRQHLDERIAWNVDDKLEEQKRALKSLAFITSITPADQNEWGIPSNYFERQKQVISASIGKDAASVRRLNPWAWSSIAASIALLIAFFAFRNESEPHSPFEKLLAAHPITEEDLEWMADEAEMALLLSDDTLVLPGDTLLPNDSLQAKQKPQHPHNPQKIASTPPTRVLQAPDWDALSEDEMWEYLLESGDADEWIEN